METRRPSPRARSRGPTRDGSRTCRPRCHPLSLQDHPQARDCRRRCTEAQAAGRRRSEQTEPPAEEEEEEQGEKADVVTFHAVSPNPGKYKVWGQFDVAGDMLIADFVLDVAAAGTEAAAPVDPHANHPH